MQTVYACGGSRGGSQQRQVADGADVVFTDSVFNMHRASCHDGLRQSIPDFHCPDAARLPVILSVRSHSNQFLLVCNGAGSAKSRNPRNARNPIFGSD